MRRSYRRPRNIQVQEKKAQPFFSGTGGIQKKDTPTTFFQKKSLTVGAPNDQYEQEADKMADSVVNQSANATDIHRKEISTIQRESLATPLEDEKLSTAEQRMEKDKMIQEKPELQTMGEKEEEMPVQAKGETGSNTASPAITHKIQDKAGKGSALSQKTRAEMESAFGTDFSGVNIHTDEEAVAMNKNLHAQAFTHGKDIYFNSGKYNPENAAGKRLLAHELTHVVQQGTLKSARHVNRNIQKQDLETGMTVSQPRADGPYNWTSSYSLEITADSVSIIVNARLIPDAGVTPQQVRQVSRETEREFLRYYDQRFNFVDEHGHRRILNVRLNYVEGGENVAINLHAGAGRDNRRNWFVDSLPIDRAHELGHQIGLLDEYVDPTVPNRATGASPGVHTDNSLMGNYYTEGKSGADVRQRHGEALAGDISAATGRTFTAEWSDTYVVREGDNLSWIARRIYGDPAKWRDIFRLNRSIIRDPNLIYPGQRLQLPPR